MKFNIKYGVNMNEIRKARNHYANGTVIIAENGSVAEFAECNYDTVRLDGKSDGDLWVPEALVVCIGPDLPLTRVRTMLIEVLSHIGKKCRTQIRRRGPKRPAKRRKVEVFEL